MMMRHPRQQLRGSPNQGISHGVQPLPESAHRLHTVKDPLPARLTRPIHTTLLSPRAADWDRLSPGFPAITSPSSRSPRQRVFICIGGVAPTKNGCVPMRNDSVTSGPNGETRLKSPGRNRGAPRESRDRGDSVPAWNGKLQPAPTARFRTTDLFRSPRTKDHLRERSWKEARKREETGRLGGDNCCRENVVGKRVQRTRISSIIPTPTQRSAVLKRVVELAKIHS